MGLDSTEKSCLKAVRVTAEEEIALMIDPKGAYAAAAESHRRRLL